MDKLGEFIKLARKAVNCRECFIGTGLQAPLIGLAQPRWVGPHYYHSIPKIMLIMLNPGSGEGYDPSPNKIFLSHLRKFKRGEDNLSVIFDHQRNNFVTWGISGKFTKFYITGLGLNLDYIATANIAWCSTAGNVQHSWMFRKCFDKFTAELVRILSPDIILLSGTFTHPYARDIQELIPKVTCIPMLHYAHREGKPKEKQELQRVRGIIDALK